MTPNNQPELISDSVDTTGTDTMQTPSALQALPAELIGMLSELLDNDDLLAMRETCRELCDGSALAFCHRFLTSIAISGTRASVQQLISIMASPNLPHAQHTVRNLVVSATLLRPFDEYSEPDAIDVTCLLQSMPKLTTTKLVDDRTDAGPNRLANAAPVFLACLADPTLHATSHLSRLNLFAVRLEGYLLPDLLDAHSRNLRIVSLNLVTVTSPTALLRGLETLHSAEIEGLELAWTQYENSRSQKIGEVPFPRRDLKELVQTPVRAGGEAIDTGPVVMGVCGVEATRGWVKPVLAIFLRYLGGKLRSK